MRARIYHITRRSSWLAAQAEGVYTADSLTGEGFIHCSKHEQVSRVANFLFHGQTELVLLEIDPTLLHSEVRWDPGVDKPEEVFPHIYGPINLEAVCRVLDYHPYTEGAFQPPSL